MASSTLGENAKNMNLTKDQCKELRAFGISEEEYKKLIEYNKDNLLTGEGTQCTILTKEQRKELNDLVEEDDEYTIYDYMRDKKFTIPGLEEKDEEKFEELLNQITPIEIIEKKEEIVEVPKKEYDRVNIKMEKELYDKVIYAAYCYDKDVTSFVTELLAKYLEKVEVDQDVVEKIRAKNKSRRAGDK